MKNILQFIGYMYSWYIRLLERKIGYRVEFTNIPNTWINGLVRFNMGPSWAKHGIRTWGVNHWTMGARDKNGVSSRYDRNAKQYQSWLGAYLVKFKENREFTLQDHFSLAVADQKNWLYDFGDPNPCIEMPTGNIMSSKQIQINGYQGTLYDFSGGLSHSDVGSKSNNSLCRRLMKGAAILLNISNPTLNIKYTNLIPTDIHTEYETITLRGYIAVVSLGKNTYVVLYGNGTALSDDKGNETKDYTPTLKEDILRAFNAVRIEKL